MQEDEIPVSGRNNYEIPEDSGAFPGEVPLKAKGSYNFADESAFTPDEKPIGGTGAYNLPSEEAPEDSGEEETGPLEKRLESKA